ncbi:MAG: hypothetical protein V1902_00550 [Candidatus Falkowbacteria bacterium]
MILGSRYKVIITGVLAIFLLSIFVSVMPAKAQVGGVVFDQFAFTQRQIYHTGDQAEKIKDKVETRVEDELWKTMVLTASVTLRNVALYLAKSAAESAVDMIATGDWGKGPLFETQGWKEMLKSEYEYAAGNVIEYIAEGIYAATGFDICAPKLDFKIWLTTNLGQMHDLMPRPQPYCTPTNVLDNWENFADEWKEKFKSPEAASLTALDTVALAFAPTKNPFGLYLTFNDQILAQAAEEQDAKEKERQEARGWKVQKNQIGTKVVAPASVTSGMAERDIVRSESVTESSYDVATSVIEDIPEQMLSTFVNTLMSRGIMEAIRKAIMRGFASASESYNPKEKVYDIEKGTEKAILALKTVNVAYSYKEINLLEEFMFCPNASAAGNNIRSINNCVLDENFYDAVAESSSGKALTVQQAIDQKDLNPDWPLTADVEKNTNSECYMQGYCYGNLVKLRKARILPVGWEMAAKIAEQKGTPVTLGEAIKGFYDQNSSWYHLVDPNWLLMAPLQRCRVQGYNDMLYAKGGDSRQEVCVDTQDCVRVDENGKCVGGWGYCRAEENVWKLDGEKCLGQYDSCLSLVRRDNKAFDYLKNTLIEDSLTCNEQNVGCKWYSAWKNANNWSQDEQYKLLANAKLTEKTCAPSAEGCSNFIEEKPGIGLNILPNADFEDTSAGSVTPGWNSVQNKATLTIIKDTVFSGSQAIKVQVLSINPNGAGLQVGNNPVDTIKIAPQPIPRFFAFSGYVLIPGELTGTWKLDARCSKDNGTVFDGMVKDSDNVWNNATPKNQWIRKYIVIETKPYVNSLRLAFSTSDGTGTINVDAAMIEEIDPFLYGYTASKFKPYGEGGAAFLKRAPDYYQCYNMIDDAGKDIAGVVGTPYLRKNIKIDDDANACGKFAKMCSADEVGCEQFTNKQTNVSVVGVPSYYDYCPSTCAGYDVFEQMASNFEANIFPFYMIPQTAQTCSAEQAGCDEFTNLEVVEKGGEGKEYYSELRLCYRPVPDNNPEVPDEKSDPKCSPFYTWTGSDVSGYQLLTYALRDEDKNGQPDITTNDDSTFCNQTIYNQNLANKKVSDCREFYSDTGKKSYHLYTKTITCSVDCHPYRRTIGNKTDCESFGGSWEDEACVYMAIPKEGRVCSKTNAGCREYQGSQAGNVESVLNATFEQEAIKVPVEINVQDALCNPAKTYYVDADSVIVNPISWDAAKGICKFLEHNIPQEKTKAEMCSYAGYYWQNSTKKCLEFEPIGATYQAWKPGVVSSESLYSGGHSLLLDINVQSTENDLTGKIFAGTHYRLSFWAKHTLAKDAQAIVGVKVLGDAGKSFQNNTAVTLQNNNEWHYYNTKDFFVGADILADIKKLTLKLEKQFGADAKLWLDDIKLYTTVDTYYLLKQTAINTVPAICNQTLDNKILPQAMIGCAEYKDRVGGTHFLKSFTKLCPIVAVGCEAFIDKHNSDNPFSEKFLQGTPQQQEITQANLQALCDKNNPLIFNAFKKDLPSATNLYWCTAGVLGNCQTFPCAGGSGIGKTSKELCLLAGDVWDMKTNKCWEGNYLTIKADQLIYLVNDKSVQCSKDNEGCTALGTPSLNSEGKLKPLTDKAKCTKINGIWSEADGICYTNGGNQTPETSWNEVYFKVDPDEFVETLCQYSGLGCESFATTDNKTLYLFDPGEQVCEWKKVEQTADDGSVSTVTGWFAKYDKDVKGKPISCEAKQYYQDGVNNLLRVTDADFTGWAGICQNKYDKCTAFVDPSDKSQNPVGRPYYYLNDEVLDKKSCGNGVSQLKGCVLFNDTSNPQLGFASAQTYLNSAAKNYAVIAPVGKADIDTALTQCPVPACPEFKQCMLEDLADLQGQTIANSGYCLTTFVNPFEIKECLCTSKIQKEPKCTPTPPDATGAYNTLCAPLQYRNAYDSNTILKVIRERQCKEWYTCVGGHWEWISQRNQYEKKCDVLGLCTKLADGTETCSEIEVYISEDDYKNVSAFSPPQYTKRNTGFDGIEYAGYTVPGQYPLHTLKAAERAENYGYGLVFVGPSCGAGKVCPADNDNIASNDFICAEKDKVCVKNVDGTKLNTPVPKAYGSCRAYPEENSPFPGSVLKLTGGSSGEGNKEDYGGALICVNPADCGCGYQKVTYGNKARELYFAMGNESKPEWICENDHDGRAMTCTKNCMKGLENLKMCDPQGPYFYVDKLTEKPPTAGIAETCGQCLKKDKDTVSVYKGWDGYCLEKDSTNIVYGKKDQHPCLSWYPVDVPSGTLDLNNYSADAGYVPPADSGNYYCIEPALFQYPMATKQECSPVVKDVEAACGQQTYFKMIGALQESVTYAAHLQDDWTDECKDIALFKPKFEDCLWQLMGEEKHGEGEKDIPDNFTDFAGNDCEPDEATAERTRCVDAYVKAPNEEKCPNGYFPVFGPPGEPTLDSSDPKQSDSLEYKCEQQNEKSSKKGQDKEAKFECGMFCVPYGSKLNITQQRVQDLENPEHADEMWEQFETYKIAEHNGKTCFPGMYYNSPVSVTSLWDLSSVQIDNDSTADADKFFSTLYIPYRYCEGPGYPVQSTGFEYTGYPFSEVMKKLEDVNQFDYGLGCYEVAQVTEGGKGNDPLTQVVAWTDRIQSEKKLTDIVAPVVIGGDQFGFYKATQVSDFGSMNLKLDALVDAKQKATIESDVMDLIELTYCVAGNTLTLPTSYTATGTAECAGQLYGVAVSDEEGDAIEGAEGRGKSYAEFEAIAPKPSSCTEDSHCYLNDVKPICDRTDIKSQACPTNDAGALIEADVKAYWLWRDGCADLAGDITSVCPTIQQAKAISDYQQSERGQSVSYLGFINNEFKYWKHTKTENYGMPGEKPIFEEAEPFGGQCDNIVLCRIGGAHQGDKVQVQGAKLIFCETPEQWIKIGYPEGKSLDHPEYIEFEPALGCKKNKTPNDTGNQCNMGFHFILCADADTAKVDLGYKMQGSILDIDGKEIDSKPYYPSQTISSWFDDSLGGSVLTPYCTQTGVLEEEYSLGECKDFNLMCNADSNCQQFECDKTANQCVVKGGETANTIKIKDAPDFSFVGKGLLNKDSVTLRLGNLFRNIFQAYKYTVKIDNTPRAKQFVQTVDSAGIQGNLTITDALLGLDISYEPVGFANLTDDLVGTDTFAPMVAGHIKAEDGTDRAILNTLAIKTDVGLYLSGTVPEKGANKVLAAQLEFYAWADRDHMPLRRVMVDFGNGADVIGAGNSNQRYKNHKPWCGDEAGAGTLECKDYEGLMCKDAGDCELAGAAAACEVVESSFGNSSGACMEGYFSYFGLYQCKKKQIDTLPTCVDGATTTTASSDYVVAHPDYAKGCYDPAYIHDFGEEGACVYFPRVQVLDNWDWCNGSCEGAGKGCYGSVKNDSAANCKDSIAKAWTYFNGKIIVKP